MLTHRVQPDSMRSSIVSAYIEGARLEDTIKNETFDSRRSATIIAKLADALQDAYEQGIVHRDVTRANIMIDQRGVSLSIDKSARFRAHTSMFESDEVIGGRNTPPKSDFSVRL